VSGQVGYFGDLMATWSELAGTKPPQGLALDSISVAPTLFGRGEQAKHPYLYWEFYEQGVSQAVLLEGRWKGIKLKTPAAPVAVYDLAADPGERDDVAEKNPAVVARVTEIMRTAHVDNAYWKLPAK
jgi:arylsulfatase A-like enzyme